MPAQTVNCPHHCEIYRSKPRSYKELPVRLAEFGTVYRYEQSGELHGLTRVRGFTQDDAHLFVRPDQLLEEFERVIDIVLYIFKTLKFDNYTAQISLRDPNNRKPSVPTRIGRRPNRPSCRPPRKGLNTLVELGEAAFYGPKLDFMVKDAIGRKWQLGTIRWTTTCRAFRPPHTKAPTTVSTLIMIHRAVRLDGAFRGRTAGAHGRQVPAVALAPRQVVLPISEKFNYAQKVSEFLNRNDVAPRSTTATKIAAKIRDNELSASC